MDELKMADEVIRISNLNVFYKNRKRKLFSKADKKIQALYVSASPWKRERYWP